MEKKASMRMGVSKKTRATPTCSYIWIVLIALISYMYLLLLALRFQAVRVSLIHDRICAYAMVQLDRGIGVRVEYLGFSFGYFLKAG